MKYTDQELAEKMKKRLGKERQRQQRWRNRQREKGLKPITGMISQKAFDILTEEKKKTGETVSDTIEKALLHLKIQPDQCNSQKDTDVIIDRNKTSSEKGTKYQEEIIHRITRMRSDENLPFNEIARLLNEKGLETLTGEDCWDGKGIYNIYKKVETAESPPAFCAGTGKK